MRVKLDMYEDAASKPLFTKMAEFVLNGLAIPDLPHMAALPILGQICAIDYVTAKADPNHPGYNYLASFSVADTTVPDGHYQSFLVTRPDPAFESIHALNPAEHKLAVNYYGSFSGDLTFSAHMADLGLTFTPAQHHLTGGHRHSLLAVANGKADCAAIDALSFALAQKAMPDLQDRIQVLDKTAAHPGLPLICHPDLPAPVKEAMRANLLAFQETETWAALAALLDLRGITVLAERDFEKTTRRAQMAGWF